MTEQRDFWLQLHHLTGAYKASGSTADERLAELAQQFKRKAPAAQQEAADQLLMIASALGNLYSRTGVKGG